MKRGILFRGKRVDNGEWIEGNYHRQVVRNSFSNENEILWEKCFIRKSDGVFDNLFQALEVDPRTVCQLQYIERHNNYTVRVFSGDIINLWMDGEGDKEECVVDDYGCINYDFGDYEITMLQWAVDMGYKFEVIGNIHDKKQEE